MINDYNNYVDFIRFQFKQIVANDSTYDDVKLYISSEQQFEQYKDREHNAIYLVIKFYPATVNFGQSVLPFSVTGLTERNKVELARQLLLTYAETYNLVKNNDTIQIYQAPTIESNFNEVYDGFRSVISMNGTLVIGNDILNIKVSYQKSASVWEQIDYITINPIFSNTLDTQPYSSVGNHTTSVGKFGTFTLSLSTYLSNTTFITNLLKVSTYAAGYTPNTTFTIKLEYGSGISATKTLRLVTLSTSQDLGNLPYIAVTLTE